LYNWPQENDYHVPLGPFKELSREYGKWATLRDDLDAIANKPSAYLLDRTGDSMANLSKIRDKAAGKVDAIYRQAKSCTDAGPKSPSAGKLDNGCDLPAGMSIESDLPDRAKLPLPLATPGMPVELTYGSAALKSQVLDFWVKRVNEGRCKFDPNDSTYCASAFSLGNLSVPAVRDKAFVLVNALGNRCLSSVNKDGGWMAVTDDCKTVTGTISAKETQKFYYNPDKKDIYMTQSVNGKTMCLDVEGSATGSNSKVWFFPCHGGANQIFNIKAMEGNTPSDPRVNIEGQDSKRCLDIPGSNPASGIRLQIYDCGKGNQAQQWRIVAAS
jgi:hypothetical protein